MTVVRAIITLTAVLIFFMTVELTFDIDSLGPWGQFALVATTLVGVSLTARDYFYRGV